ncbi:succinate dehydrogenase cytochrome B subunit, mitochondrial [Cladorrhinum samala]|uniref:Succinate dehydrogenase cytochrome B subunit, mitochondrial n=1 Tax=Cladorrhinum samala TaxID=585594 RepID=A0AAV9HYE5_9PEZI|nr:succinate dehydrogenase cytochrome B subunit, mitochondrial [Cladorrhinum samala]
MIAQRVGTTALRRVAGKPNAFITANNLARSLSTSQTRPVATQKISADEARAILDKQRLQRPVSPHLDIYDKQQTWFGGSIWQRFTGSAFSGGLYAFGIAYLAAPALGWHLESSSLIAAFGALPAAVKASVKFLAAWPFVFHAFNGVRHLTLDLGYGMARQTIVKGGWYVWGASFVGGLALALFY